MNDSKNFYCGFRHTISRVIGEPRNDNLTCTLQMTPATHIRVFSQLFHDTSDSLDDPFGRFPVVLGDVVANLGQMRQRGGGVAHPHGSVGVTGEEGFHFFIRDKFAPVRKSQTLT